jgi:valyl-tRNA synthetase
MPFITEEIWQVLRERGDGASICVESVPKELETETDLWNGQRSEIFDSIMGEEDKSKPFAKVQSVIEQIRALRGLMNIQPAEKLPATISCSGEEICALLDGEAAIIKAMTRASELTIGMGVAKPEGSVSALAHGVEIFLTVKGAVDFAEERKRLEKELARLEGFQKSVESKLANEKFVANAAPEIVEFERQKLASARDSMTKIRANIQELA